LERKNVNKIFVKLFQNYENIIQKDPFVPKTLDEARIQRGENVCIDIKYNQVASLMSNSLALRKFDLPEQHLSSTNGHQPTLVHGK